MSEVEQAVSSDVASKEKRSFISDENYALLKQYQQEIFEATETSPTIRKMINELVSIENLEKVKSKYLKVWE
jgi:sulfur relay (sulfurtransferase) DsrC/TusE family protein